MPSQPQGWDSIVWQPCPEGIPGAKRAQCASLEVPLHREAPDSETIEIFVRKLRPAGEVRGQLWALDGGPGEAGDGFVEGWFADLVTNAGFELIVPTHRGAAYATALGCSATSDLQACIDDLHTQWGTRLQHFDTHAAAQDVVQLASSYRPAKGPALVFGGSYGTIWLQRILETSPTIFDGAYMDSAADVDANFQQLGVWAQAAGVRLLDLCAKDPLCARHFPDPVMSTLDRVVQRESTGTGCLRAINHTWSEVQGRLFRQLSGDAERAQIAPLLLQLDRCNRDDQVAIQKALEEPPKAATHVTRQFNLLLNLTVIFRELYTPTLTEAQLEAQAQSLAFAGGAARTLAARRRFFPEHFERTRLFKESEYQGPMHIVQGSLDPLIDPEALTHLQRRWQRAQLDIVELPHAGHASPRFTQRTGKESCSELWLRAFLDAPHRPLDPTCLDEVAVPDWFARTK